MSKNILKRLDEIAVSIYNKDLISCNDDNERLAVAEKFIEEN
tara:strand:- start:4183 stop:4308 length:126 start_codon:yes stop_codon:yes gene_type:complete